MQWYRGDNIKVHNVSPHSGRRRMEEEELPYILTKLLTSKWIIVKKEDIGRNISMHQVF